MSQTMRKVIIFAIWHTLFYVLCSGLTSSFDKVQSFTENVSANELECHLHFVVYNEFVNASFSFFSRPATITITSTSLASSSRWKAITGLGCNVWRVKGFLCAVALVAFFEKEPVWLREVENLETAVFDQLQKDVVADGLWSIEWQFTRHQMAGPFAAAATTVIPKVVEVLYDPQKIEGLWNLIDSKALQYTGNSGSGDRIGAAVKSLGEQIGLRLVLENIPLHFMIFNLEQNYEKNLVGWASFKEEFIYGVRFGIWLFETGTFENFGIGSDQNWHFGGYKGGNFRREGPPVKLFRVPYFPLVRYTGCPRRVVFSQIKI